MSQELKLRILYVVAPILLIAFSLFGGFVAKRLPGRCSSGWTLFRVGGFVGIFGLMVAVYLQLVEVGAGVMAIGFVLSAVGLVALLRCGMGIRR